MPRNNELDRRFERDGFWTVRKAAEWSLKDPSTIYRWARQGLIRAIKTGKNGYYIDAKSLERVADMRPMEAEK